MTWLISVFLPFLSVQILADLNSKAAENSCISQQQYASYSRSALHALRLKDTPCLNGGVCVTLNDAKAAFECKCPPEFMGDLCHILNPCWPSPCYNGGTCHVFEGREVCTCPKGFDGTYCSLDVRYSTIAPYKVPAMGRSFGRRNSKKRPGRPEESDQSAIRTQSPLKDVENQCLILQTKSETTCLNDGKCHQIDNLSFWCECPVGFTGELCQFVDACVSSPCQNGGSCVSIEDSGVCNCPPGFTGTFCEAQLATTSNKPKPPGESVTQKQHDAYDEDIDDYEDQPKQVNMKHTRLSSKKVVANACTTRELTHKEPVCMNGGTCVALHDREYECRCRLEFTGALCQFSNACSTSPCKNGGTCQPFEDSGVCECPIGYTGIYCETIDTERLRKKMQQQSTTQRVSNNNFHDTTRTHIAIPNAIISKTYNATTRLNPCLTARRHCQNNGRCIVTSNSTYECECSREFSGDHCQYENPCRDYPCKNGGTCETFDDSGVCHCRSGFSGTYCEKSKVSAVFEEDTTPKPTMSRVWRSRRKTKDSCDSLEPKCYNGGTCVPYGKKTFECLCPSAFTGDICQYINACETNPCRNGGTCESYEDSGVCKCPNGFKGTYCESIDDTTESYLSRIRKGRRFPMQFMRSGDPIKLSQALDHCDNGEDDGNKPTCLNGGRCKILDEYSYECECTVAFTGPFCQFLDVCGSFPCLNGGTCESYEDSGVCRCSKGFTGVYCEDEEVKVRLMTADVDSSEKVIEVPKERQESLLEHIYRSKIPGKHPYPMHLLTHPQRHFSDGSNENPDAEASTTKPPQDLTDRIKEGVISVPGFEDITKDMVRVGQDGTIYIRKPNKKKDSIHSNSKPSSTTDSHVEYADVDNMESNTISGSRDKRRILDASVVKVMPNGEIFLKVLLPKDYYYSKSKPSTTTTTSDSAKKKTLRSFSNIAQSFLQP